MADLKLIATNNAQTVLAAAVNASATTVRLATGTGALFPQPTAGSTYFKLSVTDAATSALNEIMNVTARSGDTLTVVRGQEGTTAQAWSANDIAANMLTAETINSLTETYSKAEIDAMGLVWAPPGASMAFWRQTAPNGWLAEDGSAVSRTTYAALFAAIGTSFGVGDGSTTFNLPDSRGMFRRGFDNRTSGGVDNGRAWGSVQADMIKSHSHGGSIADAGAHTHLFNGTTKEAGYHNHNYSMWSKSGDSNRFSLDNREFGNTTVKTSTDGLHAHTFDGTTVAAGVHSHSLKINDTGGTENRPVNIAPLYCIKY